MAEAEKHRRRTAKIKYIRKHEAFVEYAKDEKPASLINVKFDELTEAWRELEHQHDSYLAYVDDDNVATEEKWIKEARREYDEAIEKQHSTGRLVLGKSSESMMIDLEKTKLPVFTGNMRDYARFKSDFQNYVQPNLPSSIVAYTLRTCLSKEAAHRVRNTDDIKEMWNLLDEKYADAATLADMILDDIHRTRTFRDDEPQRFLDFVDMVEDGYHDLCTLGIEREMTTTSSVSVIEDKLPPKMKTQWARMVVSDPRVNKADKLPSLLTFLRTEKKTIEYRCAGLRSNEVTRVEATVQHVDISAVTNVCPDDIDKARTRTGRDTCLIHQSSSHQTCECEKYVSKSVSQRYELLKQKAACWSCLVSGHKFRDCGRKIICGVGGCRRRHHKSLHVDNPPTDSATVSHVTIAQEIPSAREINERHVPRTQPCQDNRQRLIGVPGNDFQTRMDGGSDVSDVQERDFFKENTHQRFTNTPAPQNRPMYRSNMKSPFLSPMFLCVVMTCALMSSVSAHSYGNYVHSSGLKHKSHIQHDAHLGIYDDRNIMTCMTAGQNVITTKNMSHFSKDDDLLDICAGECFVPLTKVKEHTRSTL